MLTPAGSVAPGGEPTDSADGLLVIGIKVSRTDGRAHRANARARIARRDPEHDAVRRAIRAAIVLPLAAALGFAVRGARRHRCSPSSARSRC